MDESELESTRDRRVAVGLTLGLLALVGAAYVGAHFLVEQRLPRGTSIGGVEVGGLTPAAATTKLEQRFGAVDSTITVAAEGRREDIEPSEVGLRVDYAASVDQVDRGGWNPADLMAYLVGGSEHDLVVAADSEALTGSILDFAEQVETAPRDGTVFFRGTRVRTTPSAPGRAIDIPAAIDLITQAFPEPPEVVALPMQVVEPDITDDDVREAVDGAANVAVSAPVVVVVRGQEVELRPRVFARTLSFESSEGALVLTADPKVLTRLVTTRLQNLNLAPRDATVRIVDGKPKVVPGRDGITVDPAELAVAFAGAAVSDGRRVVAATTKTAPAFTTEDAKALRIRRIVSSFTTYYPHADYRNVNIGRAAELINGTVLKPGDVFSLNGIVGERTVENGFTVGYIISDGVFKEDLGGGVSQSATTTFNAAFFAGLEDVEHKPHSLYISRYPIGREATVAWPSVDLRFRNDTPYGVLIQAWVVPSTYSSQGSITVRMWSTKHWHITTSQSAPYNYTDPGVRYIDTPDCEPFEGQRGFEIDVYRNFYKPGSKVLDHKETFHTRYLAGDKVVCGKPPKNQN